MHRQTRLRLKIIIGISAGLAAAIFVLWGAAAYPITAGDGIYFLPAAVNFSQDHGLMNSVSDLGPLIDTSGAGRFLYYPPLFPLTLAILGFGHLSGIGSLILMGILAALATIMTAILLWQSGAEEDRNMVFTSLFIMAAILQLATTLNPTGGRPEALAVLFLITWGFLLRYQDRAWFPWVSGLLLGLTLGTQLVAGVALAAVMGSLIASTVSFDRKTFWCLTRIFATGAAIFFIVLALNPADLKTTLGGILGHSRLLPAAGPSSIASWLHDLIVNYFFVRTTTFFGLSLLVFAVFWIRSAFVPWRARARMLAWIFFFIQLATLVYTLREPNRSYNIIVFAPLILLFILSENNRRAVGIWPKAFILLAIAASGIGFMRQAVLFPIYIQRGMSLEQAQTAFAAALPEASSGGSSPVIGIASGLWILTDHFNHLHQYPSSRTHYEYDYVTIQQNYSGLLVPPQIPGCEIIADHFDRQAVAWHGFTIANTVPGYNFAAYKCLIQTSELGAKKY